MNLTPADLFIDSYHHRENFIVVIEITDARKENEVGLSEEQVKQIKRQILSDQKLRELIESMIYSRQTSKKPFVSYDLWQLLKNILEESKK